MGYLDALDTSASGLSAQRLRMDIISQNIANAQVTRTENGSPYRRKVVVFEEKGGSKPFSQFLSESSKKFIGNCGVRVIKIAEDQAPFKRIYDPGHPDADENGYVQMPNVDVVVEMVDMISASRSYEANVTALNTTKSMALKALEIGK